MALKLNIAYSKKIGLPQFSSHSASASLEVELTDVQQAPGEIIRHYTMLQTALDQQLIQQPGFVPGEDSRSATAATATPRSNGHHQLPAATPAAVSPEAVTGSAVPTTWQCSAKQHNLINDLARRIGLDDHQIEARAQRLFGKPAHQLNKLSASGLISDLLAEAGPQRARNNAQNAVSPKGNGGQA